MNQRSSISLERSASVFTVTENKELLDYSRIKARYKRPSKQSTLDAYFVHLQRMMSECIDDEYKKLK